MDTTMFFSRCPTDIVLSLYAFVFQEKDNCSVVVQGTHSCTYCNTPRYLAWNPHVFLRRICSNDQRIDVLQTGEKTFEAYYEIDRYGRRFYLRTKEPGEPVVEVSRVTSDILGLVRLKTGVLVIAKEFGTIYLTDSIIPTQAQCYIINLDDFVTCTGTLLDADGLLHIEGTLENGETGLWTYCLE